MEILSVSPADRDELRAATAVEEARINYLYRLRVLDGYYDRVGNMDKLIWARRELKNLRGAQIFQWEGLPQIDPPTGESLIVTDERILVEYVVGARNAYIDATSKLTELYRRSGRIWRERLIANMRERLDPIHTYKYFLTAEVPPADLQPEALIPEADILFAAALKLHKEGKGIFGTALTTNYDKQRLAVGKLRELIERYPRSNKIALSAYHIAEIYKEYFNENIRAVHWYRRAWQWDPNITKPARFQAAAIYDFRLQQPRKALECYRLAIRHEQFNASNMRYSHQRIKELESR